MRIPKALRPLRHAAAGLEPNKTLYYHPVVLGSTSPPSLFGPIKPSSPSPGLRLLAHSGMQPRGSMGKQIAPQVPTTTPRSSSEAAVAAQEVRPSNSVIGFYSHKQGHPYREFSNFFRHIQPFEFVLPAFAQRDGFAKSIWCSFSERPSWRRRLP